MKLRSGESAPAGTTVASRAQLLRLFLREKSDPNPFYRQLAERTIGELRRELQGRRILDLGCGHGHDTLALRAAGADAVALDLKTTNLDPALDEVVRGDARLLPFADASFDGVFCSNLLEHTPAVAPVLAEIERVLKPQGWAWISWTNWYSPWGGHEIVPLHFLGPRRGYDAWVRLFGVPRVNVPYDELWPTHIGPVLKLLDRQTGLRLVDAKPRYWPSQRWLLKIPVLREVATWNCVLEVQRVEAPPTA